MGLTHHIHASTAYRQCAKLLKVLPHCADITRKYCTHFSGILLVDGKYVKVKRYERKIPTLYGIDYLTHDIPNYILSVAENYPTCLKFFQSLRLMNYPLQAVVCDDNVNIYKAAQQVYPKVVIQLCHNHYKQSIRAALNVSHDPTYVPFMKAIEHLCGKRRSIIEFQGIAAKITAKFGSDPRCMSVLADIQRRLPFLTGYTAQKRIPRTTNLIESFNSHLQGRLKTIKGFESFGHADYWLNGYFLKRRFTPFTSCGKPFRHLNGKSSLQKSMKNPEKITDLFKLIR